MSHKNSKRMRRAARKAAEPISMNALDEFIVYISCMPFFRRSWLLFKMAIGRHAWQKRLKEKIKLKKQADKAGKKALDKQTA